MAKVIGIFGDTHGRSDMLEALHKKIKDLHGDIPLYSCGDLVDRGPDSAGVIQYCIDNGIEAVVGNHDDWLRRLCVNMQFDSFALAPVMGGTHTALSYGATSATGFQRGASTADIAEEIYQMVPQDHKDWLKDLPFYRKVVLDSGEVYWILHAGLTNPAANSFLSVSSNDDELMLHFLKYRRTMDLLIWARPRYPHTNSLGEVNRPGYKEDDLYQFRDGATQVFGHSIRTDAIVRDHYVALDTGCGTRSLGKLTAIIMPSREIVTIEENDVVDWV